MIPPIGPPARPVPLPAEQKPAEPAPQPQPPTDNDRLHTTLYSSPLPASRLNFALSKDDFVSRQGSQFSLHGQPFRFVGCNMYSLTWEKPAVSEKMIADAAAEGFTVIRFWANKTTPEQLQQILDNAQKYQVKLIPVLANNGAFTPEMKNGDAFYREGYKKDYLPYVENLARQFQDRPEIMMWELVNEPESENFQPLLDFSQDVSTRLKQADPHHLVSIGTIGGIADKFGSELSRLSTEHFRALHSLPNLDAVSIHDYSYDATAFERLDLLMRNQGNKSWSARFGKIDQITGYVSRKVDELLLDTFHARLYKPWTVRGLWMHNNQQDLQIARELGKPLYVGEAGFKKFHGNDRKTLFDLDMQHYFKSGAQGYMLWSYQAEGRSVDGHDYGFDSQDGFAPLIQNWKQKLAQEK